MALKQNSEGIKLPELLADSLPKYGDQAVAPSLMASAAPTSRAANRLKFIDALRGFACVWVILCHVHGYWLDGFRPHGWNLTTFVTRAAGFGGKGVDLFIVLSGFCLYWPLVSRNRENQRFNVRQFFNRRSKRILPAYYLALTICTCLILIPALQPLLVSRPITGTDALSHLFLVQTFSGSTTAAINGSFWSLALEIQLYLTFPLLLSIGRRSGMRGIAITGLCTAVFYQIAIWLLSTQSATASWVSVMPMHLPAHWLEFIAGMAAAKWVARPVPSHKWRAIFALVIMLPIGIIEVPLGLPIVVFSNVLWGGIFAALIVLVATFPAPTFVSTRRLGPLTAIGAISYSLYLVQQPFLLLTAPLARSLHTSPLTMFLLAIAVALPAMCAIAYLMYRVVERPFMRMV